MISPELQEHSTPSLTAQANDSEVWTHFAGSTSPALFSWPVRFIIWAASCDIIILDVWRLVCAGFRSSRLQGDVYARRWLWMHYQEKPKYFSCGNICSYGFAYRTLPISLICHSIPTSSILSEESFFSARCTRISKLDSLEPCSSCFLPRYPFLLPNNQLGSASWQLWLRISLRQLYHSTFSPLSSIYHVVEGSTRDAHHKSSAIPVASLYSILSSISLSEKSQYLYSVPLVLDQYPSKIQHSVHLQHSKHPMDRIHPTSPCLWKKIHPFQRFSKHHIHKFPCRLGHPHNTRQCYQSVSRLFQASLAMSK